ncbi:hypothetical protein CJ195_04180 [Bacillus sp. UMB0899]|uniref:hypothetical protein n=1 Tax=Metabacillus schmidteae TaxID=2730405 RepID=UPI000C8055B7|nr:hypothetical protein [Metabacillus schmidteae]PMC39144.1 hypothetical protein CJ195_04180 [Bacillus sp. UMB0899]
MSFKSVFIILLLSFPLLVSFETIDNQPLASYISPEGIYFTSYTPSWDEKKLKDLYKELLLNKHGEEITELNEIRILGGTHSSTNTKGSYHSLNQTIVLYQGATFDKPLDYRETLSHEYGHHFAYYYFPTHHLPFSKWQRIRGIDVTDMRWDAFWNYDEQFHAIYPQEIIADDYVLLYGATSELDSDEIVSNEAFYLRTQHENQEIPNVLENKKLHSFLEEETGIPIDLSRTLDSPKFIEWNDQDIIFSVSSRENVAYRLNLELFDYQSGKQLVELYEITSEETTKLSFSLNEEDIHNISDYEYAIISIDVVDLTTSIGFETDETQVSL